MHTHYTQMHNQAIVDRLFINYFILSWNGHLQFYPNEIPTINRRVTATAYI